MSRYNLLESVRGIFDAAGICRVRIGPSRAFERWVITGMTIQTSSTAITAFRVYRGEMEAPSALIDLSNFNGNNDVSDTRTELTPTEKLLGVWTGGTPGAAGTLTVSGESVR